LEYFFQKFIYVRIRGNNSTYQEGNKLNKSLPNKGKRRTVSEINEKIRNGDVQVLTADEMKELVESSGIKVAFEEVDVVTTGTFGAMCSSGAAGATSWRI